MLELSSVTKKFKSVVTADNLSVKLENYTYGLLGKNGSGKTTLLRCITGMYRLDGGSICYVDKDGKEQKKYLEKIGYMPQSFEIFPELTCFEILKFFADLKKIDITDDEIDALLEKVNLTEKKKEAFKTLSGGMKRRLGIAQSLIGKPEILLLDEPTSGLDPGERLNFKNVIHAEKGNRCIVLSTHIITDIEALCDRILVLKNAKITEFETVSQLADFAKGKVFAVDPETHVKIEGAREYVIASFEKGGKEYSRIASSSCADGTELEPTVEDGYICFIEDIR